MTVIGTAITGGGKDRRSRSLFLVAAFLLTSTLIGCSSNRPPQRWWRIGGVHILATAENLWIVVEKQEWKQRASQLAAPNRLIIRRRYTVFQIVGGEIIRKDSPQRDADLLLSPDLTTLFAVDDCLFAHKKLPSRLYCWDNGKGFRPVDASDCSDKFTEATGTPLSTKNAVAPSDIGDLVESMALKRDYDGSELPIDFDWGSRTIKLEVDSGGAVPALEVLIEQNDVGESKPDVD